MKFAFIPAIIIDGEIAKTYTSFLALYWIFAGIVTFFIIGVIFEPAQIFVIQFFIFFDRGDITANS